MQKKQIFARVIGIDKKIGVATHFFKIISLECQQNADICIFLKKEEKNISCQSFLEFAFTYRKANTVVEILKLHGTMKTIFSMFL